MDKAPDKLFDVDALLGSLFPAQKLSDLFEYRLKELNILPTNALHILGIEYRALQGILHGTNKRVDYTNFIKLASFLKISKEQVLSLYLESLEKNFPSVPAYPQHKLEYINANFDLATLKKAGFIDSISDYWHIENKINSYFGYASIFEYRQPSQHVAFSAGVRQPKNTLNRGLWVNAAVNAFKEISNPNSYQREALIKFFPQIRWYCTNVEQGLPAVIKELYQLGVTVFYQSSLPALHLKGATLIIDDKPGIVLTDYKGFYASLWHTLCHELSHVLFDFDQIKENCYHISDESPEDLGVAEREAEADNFAREYLFSREKSQQIKPYITRKKTIEKIALQNHVHPSLIYAYHAFDEGKADEKGWKRAMRNNPSFDSFLNLIENPWSDSKPLKEHVDFLKNHSNIYH